MTAPRRSARRGCQTIAHGARGMTLVEVLVVLAIVAISGAAIVLSIGSDKGIDSRAAARRIQAQVQLAADQTMIADVPMALQLGKDGYRFVELSEETGAWGPSRDPALFETFTVPEGMTLTADATLLPIDVNGAALPFRLVLAGDAGRWVIAFDGITARLAPEGET